MNIPLILSGFFMGVILSSFTEYAIHKYFLHSTPKVLIKSKYVRGMWRGHSISHHGHYLPDYHYTQDSTNKNEVLTFSWYEGPLIIILFSSIVYFIVAIVRRAIGLKFTFIMPEALGAAIAITLYYIAYESLHAIMHVPNKWRWLMGRKFMVLLNRHHYQHHIDPRTNLNVVLPLADTVLGTRRTLPKWHHQFADKINILAYES